MKTVTAGKAGQAGQKESKGEKKREDGKHMERFPDGLESLSKMREVAGWWWRYSEPPGSDNLERIDDVKRDYCFQEER